MAIFTTLNEVQVFGGITHGRDNVVYDDNQIKELVGKKAGAYGRHWVYGDRLGRRSIDLNEGDIMVVYGNQDNEKHTFAGRDALKDCLEFLGQFTAQ
jgi:hypothetical protein